MVECNFQWLTRISLFQYFALLKPCGDVQALRDTESVCVFNTVSYSSYNVFTAAKINAKRLKLNKKYWYNHFQI